ncbi:MAG: hypothetical protein WCK91_03060, partial [bacterium]
MDPNPATKTPEVQPEVITPLEVATTEAQEPQEDTRGAALENARTHYIEEKIKYLGTLKNRVTMRELRESLGLLTGNERKDEEEKLSEFKKEYDIARVGFGNKMLEEKKSELIDSGLSGEALEKAIVEFKATEVLQTLIIDERQKIIDARAEKADAENKEKGFMRNMLDKTLKGYLTMKPAWKKRAISIAITMIPAAVAAGISAPAIISLGGLALVKIGRSMAVGGVTLVTNKAY